MKKVIEGKIYSTKNARMIGSDYANCSCNDFRFWKETLYQTTKGTYFLSGEGGALSKWGSHYDGASYYGTDIRVLAPVSARAWAQEHMGADEYINEFSPEDG